MKIRIADRFLVAVAGLVLICAAAAMVAQLGFGVAVLPLIQGRVDVWMQQNKLITTIGQWGVAAVLALLGLYCVGVLFRHQKKNKRGFVMQQTDCGELSISIRAIEGLVQKCVDRHEEIHVMSTALDTSRDGLIIKLRIGLAGGVNIPLAVSALQKQIKQYVTSCSGVDVKEVKVQVETSASKGKKSRYEVPEMLEKPAPLPMVEEPAAEPVKAEPEAEAAEEKRPLHQRVFGCGEQPANMPQPPAEPVVAEEPAPAPQEPAEEETKAEEPAAEEPVQAPAAEEAEAPVAEETPADEESKAEEENVNEIAE